MPYFYDPTYIIIIPAIIFALIAQINRHQPFKYSKVRNARGLRAEMLRDRF